MKSAYNEVWLYNLEVIKESKRWLDAKLISENQLTQITESYTSSCYHPNFIIRILIFIATLIGLSGVTGLLSLAFLDAGESAISFGCIIYGIISFYAADAALISRSKHFKSGITEALIYHACIFTIGGFAGLFDFAILPTLLMGIVVLSFSAYRYLDLISTIASALTFASLIFYEFYELGGLFQQIIPFIFIIIFTPIYFASKRLRKKNSYRVWNNNLIIIETTSLLLIYLAGNYLVVRELSVNLLNSPLSDGQDIPFAILFYILTAVTPMAYLYFGIKNKDFVLIRVSLVVLAFSVFTLKYYSGFENLEITLTVLGLILVSVSLALLNYLKGIKHGYTRENLLSEKWSSVNAEAFVISQTMGGNLVNADFKGDGGDFGGGGASGSF